MSTCHRISGAGVERRDAGRVAGGSQDRYGIDDDDLHRRHQHRLLPAGIGYWNANDPQLKQLTVDPKTVVGMGSDAKGLLLIRQDSPTKLSVERVE